MSPTSDEHQDSSEVVWSPAEEAGASSFDEDCSPTRVCRNARDFSFEGIARDGQDLPTAWRETLEREGKFNRSAESIRDLVLGQSASD